MHYTIDVDSMLTLYFSPQKGDTLLILLQLILKCK